MISVLERYDDNPIELINSIRRGQNGFRKDSATSDFFIDKIFPLNNDELTLRGTFNASVSYSYVVKMIDGLLDGDVDFEKKIIIKKIMPLLFELNKHNGFLANRSLFLLSECYLLLGDKETSIDYFFQSQRRKNTVGNQKLFVAKFIFGVDVERYFSRKTLKLFTEEDNIYNVCFWHKIKNLCSGVNILNSLSTYINKLTYSEFVSAKPCANIAGNVADDIIFFESINSQMECKCLGLTKLYYICKSDDYTSIAKSKAYYIIALTYCCNDVLKVLHYLTMSLFYKYDVKTAIKIQSLFIDVDEPGLLDALLGQGAKNKTHSFLSSVKYIKDSHSFVTWCTVNINNEVSLLLSIINSGAGDLIKTMARLRLCFLYIRGESCNNSLFRIQRFSKATELLELYKNSSSDSVVDFISDITNSGFYRHQSHLISNSEFGEYIFMENKSSNKLIIVFPSRYSYHVFTSVPSFVKNTCANILFVNNPECNWFSDEEFLRVECLINHVMKGRFEKNNTLCYFGSMGGYAAIKYAIRLKCHVLAFNPQFNLNLWAMERPEDIDRILLNRSVVNLDKISPKDNDGFSGCLLVSRSPADFLAFQSWFENFKNTENFTLIIEKYEFVEHDALISNAYKDTITETLMQRFNSLISYSNNDLKITPPLNVTEQDELITIIKNSTSGSWTIKSKNGLWYLL
nr:Uncharacterised protein [Citrobacter werkmanii]